MLVLLTCFGPQRPVTSSEEEMKDFDTVKPTVMFGSKGGSKKGKLAHPCFHMAAEPEYPKQTL